MKMSVALAGFTPGEADSLRKAMSKKIPEVIEKQREEFVRGAKEKGVGKKISEKIFNNIVAFAGYGFNKSHSAAYGIISYKTAYLKANYPLEYITALFNSEIGRPAAKSNEESKLVTYLNDTPAFGIKVLPPDVQRSDGKFKIEGKNIRFGLLAIKNVGKGVTESIEQSRIENGQLKSFKDWIDFLQRIDLKSINKKALESLIKAGVFDSFGTDKFAIRGGLIQNIDSYADKAAKIKQYRESLQGLLFESANPITDILSFKDGKTLEPLEALNFEKEVLGFYTSGHPLTHRKKDLIAYSNYRLDKLPQLKGNADRKTVRIAGMITSVKKLISKTKKEPYARFKIEDLHGSVDILLFPNNFEKLSSYLTLNNIVVIKGWLTNMQGQLEIIAEDIMTIDEAKKKFPSKCDEIHIKFPVKRFDDDALEEELKKIFNTYAGKTKIYLILEDSLHGNFSIETKYLSDCSDNFINDVETVIGFKDSVKLHYTN
jgi:DNA polymerase-3 subunit alpha